MTSSTDKISEKEEERTNTFFKNAADGLLVSLFVADKKFGNFIEINEQACRLLNYSHKELSGFSIYNLISIKEQQKLFDYTDQLLLKGQLIFEIVLLTKNGPKVPVEINAKLFDYNQNPAVIFAVRDNTARSQDHNKLSNSREQLRNLALRIQNIREEERTIIAREIHDELGQLLTVLKIQLSLISKKLTRNQADIQDRIKSSLRYIDQAVHFIQKITTQLRPGILDELGLKPAIEWQAREFEQQTGIRCNCTLTKGHIDLNPEHSTALFRITQEALTNVARHSYAKRVSIYLTRKDEKLILEVTDNGRGINNYQINSPDSLGLLGIRERAMVFGGKVSINGVAGQGTNLKVEWPLTELSSETADSQTQSIQK